MYYKAIYNWKKKYKLTQEVVTIGPKRRTKIILDTTYSTYYSTYAWANVLASKKNYYLCEYTCPHTHTLIREWVHENYVEMQFLYD